MKKKYAIIPINRRIKDDGSRDVRCVLISYKKSKRGVYVNTRLVEKDDYFKNREASHVYSFDDDGFVLVRDRYGDNWLLNQKRPYKVHEGNLIESSIEFKAKNDEDAIKTFNGERKWDYGKFCKYTWVL